jgi:hypothetical protein
MNSSDFRLVRLTPTTTASSFSGGGGSFYDANGTLQTAPPNTLRLTYDPADLTRGPAALIEPEATNHSPNSTVQGVATGIPGTLPTGWFASTNVPGLMRQILGRNFDSGIEFVDIRIFGTVGAIALPEYTFQFTNVIPAAADQVWSSSVFARVNGGPTRISQLQAFEHYIIAFRADGTIAEATAKATAPTHTTLRDNRLTYTRQIKAQDTVSVVHRLDLNLRNGGNYEVDVTVRIGLPQLERDRVTSPIRTSSGAVTRAADVVGAAGLVYSNVPITEPLWVAGTYAKGAKVRDAANLVYESLADGNTAVLTEKLKWLPLGATNRWKVFDKAVNSQTTAPGLLTFSVKPGVVAGTLMLLNMEGASVTVSQSESGYVKTQSLVRHEVDNWYDFYYEEPIRAGDAVFTDIPPYPSATLTVAIDNGPGEAKIGACLVGKPLVIGKVTASFSAGVLSYSTSNADTFGNIEMVKRYNAPRMNFDVMIPAGREDEAYRVLRQFTDTEIGVIVGDAYAMGIGYGFLGQWDVPKSGNGRTARIEFKGLV